MDMVSGGLRRFGLATALFTSMLLLSSDTEAQWRTQRTERANGWDTDSYLTFLVHNGRHLEVKVLVGRFPQQVEVNANGEGRFQEHDPPVMGRSFDVAVESGYAYFDQDEYAVTAEGLVRIRPYGTASGGAASTRGLTGGARSDNSVMLIQRGFDNFGTARFYFLKGLDMTVHDGHGATVTFNSNQVGHYVEIRNGDFRVQTPTPIPLSGDIRDFVCGVVARARNDADGFDAHIPCLMLVCQ